MKREISLFCDGDLQFQLEDIAHLILDFMEQDCTETIKKDDKEVKASKLPKEVVDALMSLYRSAMSAAFQVHVWEDFKNTQRLIENRV